MKKILSWMFLLLTIATLVGCNKSGEDPIVEDIREYGELRVVTNFLNRGLMLNTAEAQNGYYEFVGWIGEMYAHEETSSWMHAGNIVYTDYATKTRVFLCGTPGCMHNNEQCTSYLRYSRGVKLFTNSTGTQLFLMSTGAQGGEAYSEEDLGRIYTMDMDGSNRREIYRLRSNENFDESADVTIADETHLFVCVSVTENAQDDGHKREVREIDLIDGRITPLFGLSPLEMVVSAFDDTIVTAQEEEREVPQWSEDMTGADAMNAGSAKYYGYSVKDGTTWELADKSNYHAVAAGPYLIFRRADSDTSVEITRYNLITGEEEVFPGLPTAPRAYIWMYDYFDGRVEWFSTEVVDGEIIDYQYILNCDTGEYREFTLTFETNMGGVYTRFVPILAEHGDQFLVQADSVESTMTLINREGIPFVYDYTYRPVYALMSKEDYWNSIPNYTFIEDTVGL